MKEKNCLFIEPSLTRSISGNKSRQAIIGKVISKSITGVDTEQMAFSMFLWHLADINPPVNQTEQLVFKALYRMSNSYHNFTIKDRQQALDILDIPHDILHLSWEEVIKQAKIKYWHHFNNLSGDMQSFVINAGEIGLLKKAFNFLCHQIIA